MMIQRNKYLNELVSYLEEQGIAPEQIIKVNLEDFKHRALRNPDNMYSYVESQIKDDRIHYILLDEIQMLEHFEDVLNGFLNMPNVEVYVTGSNAKFLSKDIRCVSANICRHIMAPFKPD